MVDLWIAKPNKFIGAAMEEGFRKFTWHLGGLLKDRMELLSWMRLNTAAYGPSQILCIAHHGASLYSTFSNYMKPLAVYPTWAADEDEKDLHWLMQNNVGEIEKFYTDQSVPPEMRPVKGQQHMVVVHRIPPAGPGRRLFALKMRQFQLDYPECKLLVSGLTDFSDMFGIGLGAVDYLPHELTMDGFSQNRIVLPTGKRLSPDKIHDTRYADWFELIGLRQWDVLDQQDRVVVCLRSARWAALNWDRVTPFVKPHSSMAGPRLIFMADAYKRTPDDLFVLPASRRIAMRNLGLNFTELDKFYCDTCILHNACTLYREGSVCTVKGSETMGLADAFGSRDANVILDGLTQLVKRNAERLEDALSEEEASGELDPEVTKLTKVVFDQGTKLAKLRDPSLAGGAKVQVNVGVGAGGQANVGIAAADPRQITASIVAELEASGIPREQITSDMVKGVLRSMAQSTQQQAINTASTTYKTKAAKSAQAALPASGTIQGTVVNSDDK